MARSSNLLLVKHPRRYGTKEALQTYCSAQVLLKVYSVCESPFIMRIATI